MTNKSPIFPFQQPPQHFSDYGFDPQLDYFQVLEEARKHKQRETSSSFRSSSSSIIDSLHFKLQKPISKDNNIDTSKKIKKNQKRWWKNAFHFFKRKRTTNKCDNLVYSSSGSSARVFSGPVYFTDSSSTNKSGSSTPYHLRSSPASSGPLARGEFDISIPYISLTQLNNMDQTRHHKMPTSPPMPIYLVT
uniref:uncharacterized protein LOC122580040 n=1 Tax=Erigeron canadensis TaxID=72917 RepID=UPI001CB91F9F|nr:uncharacterized protein LOC122580040 [Erigeron canadensis]